MNSVEKQCALTVFPLLCTYGEEISDPIRLARALVQRPASSVQEEAIRFRLDEEAMPEGVAQERAQQLLMVCRHLSHGNIVAVSTAFPQRIKSLQLDCFHFRAFVGQQNRASRLRSSMLIHDLLRQSYDVLNARYQTGHDVNVVGVYMDVHNASVVRHRRELVWTD